MKSYLNPVPKSGVVSGINTEVVEWKEATQDGSSNTSTLHKKSQKNSITRKVWYLPSHFRWRSIGAGFLIGAILMIIIHFSLPSTYPTSSSNVTPSSTQRDPMWPTPGALFSYDMSRADGPLSWGSVKNTTGSILFPKCNPTVNLYQSPVDLPVVTLPADNIPLKTLFFNYTTDEFAIRARRRNPGFQLEPIEDDLGIDDDIPDIVDPGGIVDGLNGILLAEFHQGHMHWPSEHTVNGTNFALELHLVHETVQSNDDNTSSTFLNSINITEHVVSILFPKSKNGAHNSRLDSFLMDAIGPVTPELIGKVDFEVLLADTENYYYTYDGGLTSPPCTPGVRWYIFVSKSGVNDLQIDAMSDVLGGQKNNRPTLEKMGREVNVYMSKR
jgi:hypothetical protein